MCKVHTGSARGYLQSIDAAKATDFIRIFLLKVKPAIEDDIVHCDYILLYFHIIFLSHLRQISVAAGEFKLKESSSIRLYFWTQPRALSPEFL